MMLELYAIAFLGFLLHVTGRYIEYTRAVARVSPLGYLRLDPAAWFSAIIGTVVAVMLLKDVNVILEVAGVPPALHDKLLAATRVLYFLAGYGGSSIVAKIPGMLLPRFSDPTKR